MPPLRDPQLRARIEKAFRQSRWSLNVVTWKEAGARDWVEQNLEGKTHRHLNWLIYEFIRDGGQVNRKPERRHFDEDYFFDLVISVDGHPVYVEFVITDDDPDDPDDYPNVRIVSVHPADP